MTPVESALLRIADNVARHIMQRSGWTADDVCFRVDLRKAETEIEAVIAEAVAREREACIAIAEARCQEWDDEGDGESVMASQQYYGMASAGRDIAAAIRKRGKP